MNKTTLRIVIGVALVVIVGLVGWYGFRNKGSNPADEPTPEAAVTVPPLSYDMPPADWAKYASMGFEVSYPKDWKTGSCGPTCVTFASPDSPDVPAIGINVTASASLNEVLTTAAPYVQASASVDFNDVKWIKLELKEPQTGSVFVSHFAARGKELIELGLAAITDANAKIYAQMVRSFKLTK